jgi:PAS domain S-box-containing protein
MPYKSVPLDILVIEDQPGDFILIEDYLNEEQDIIKISRAVSYMEAENLLKSSTFDAILLDLSLPDEGNRETLTKNIVILSKNAPVIVLTVFADTGFGVKSLSLGISDYLLKDELNAVQLSKSIHYGIERKRIESQLRESENKYKNLFDSSPLPMWVLERCSSRILSVNDATVDLYGYSREEFLGMSIKELWAGTDEPETEIMDLIKRDGFFKLNISHRKKNGEIVHLKIQSNPIIFDGKEARVALANNITASLEAKQALKNSEQRFKALVQDGSDLLMILNFDGKLTYVSPSSKLVMGITSELLIKYNLFEFIHEDDLDQVKESITLLHSKKRVQIPSYRIKTSKNKWKWLETILTNLYDDSSVNGIVANSRDITEFVQQEKELLESLKRYNIVEKATSDTITDYDVQNDVMHYNEGMELMFGYTRDQISTKGSWWDDKVHPEDAERVKNKVDLVYKKGHGNLQVNYRFRCADGNYKYILDRTYLVTNEKGEPIRMIGSMQDITEIHNYIETIERHNDRLKDIAWTQSHVVRAPLSRIMGLIDSLENFEDMDDQAQLLSHILTSARELDGIIRTINSKTVESISQSRKC